MLDILCIALLSVDGITEDVASGLVGQARRQFFAAVASSLEPMGTGDGIMQCDPTAVKQARFADAGAAFFGLVAAAMAESQELQRSAALVQTSTKGAQFTFGDQADFEGGVQGMIGQVTSATAYVPCSTSACTVPCVVSAYCVCLV
eukprot:SAG31_NODE_567_length_14028_cov_4.022328_10_plen_146_part_00